MGTDNESIGIKSFLIDLVSIFGIICISLYILLQIINGLKYYDSLSIEWWIIITLILLMAKSDFLEIGALKRLEKYKKLIKFNRN